MARYEIRTPDGARYEVTAPDDMPQDAVVAHFRQQMAQPSPASQAGSPAPRRGANEPSRLDLLLEAERRGILDAPNAELLAEARRRGIVPPLDRAGFDASIAGRSPEASQQLNWSDVPGKAFDNLGSSAANFAKNIVTPFLEPVQTVNALAEVGKGVVSKAAGLVVNQDPVEKAKREAAANAVGQFFADRYGSLDAIKHTLATDPVGAAADAATVLTGGGAALARAPGVAGQVGNAVRATGSAIDPIANAGRVVGAAGRGVSHVLGMTTGAGSMPVQTAFQAGRQGGQAGTAFTDSMRGYAPVSDVVDMAETAVKELTRQRGDAYKAGIAATKADPTVLNMAPIRTALDDALKSITYQDVAINPQARKAVSEVYRTIKRFEKIPNNQGSTAAGLDAMKQAVGGIMERHKPGTQPFRVVKQVYDAIGAEIRNQVPNYAATMKGYSQASDQLGELRRTFSVETGATADTTARKLLSVTRNNVNTNYGERARLFDVMARQPGAETLPAAIAGHAMSSATPRGLQQITAGSAGASALAQFTSPATLAALPAFSPRIVGEASYGAGRVAGLVDQLSRSLRLPPARARQLLMSSYGANVISEASDGPGLLSSRP